MKEWGPHTKLLELFLNTLPVSFHSCPDHTERQWTLSILLCFIFSKYFSTETSLLLLFQSESTDCQSFFHWCFGLSLPLLQNQESYHCCISWLRQLRKYWCDFFHWQKCYETTMVGVWVIYHCLQVIWLSRICGRCYSMCFPSKL